MSLERARGFLFLASIVFGLLFAFDLVAICTFLGAPIVSFSGFLIAVGLVVFGLVTHGRWREDIYFNPPEATTASPYNVFTVVGIFLLVGTFLSGMWVWSDIHPYNIGF